MRFSHFHQKRASGHFPQYGAIFMADNYTRNECFARKLFALPSHYSDFVMKVKAGMPLFLFDYQDKKCYGVFMATSDGALNIVPNAYSSSGRQFPAQVRFNILWRCRPVPEPALHDAIVENYFSDYKFNFGLSRHQVQKLLHLFEKRKIETVIPRTPLLKKECEISGRIEDSATESQHKSQDSSETPPNSIPEKPASLRASDNEAAANLGDFIQLPSVDSEEIAIPLCDGLSAEDFIPLPPVDPEEIEDSFSGGLEWEEGACLLKGIICPEALECDNSEKGDEPTDNDNKVQVRGLYSDIKDNRSVFHRISGLSKVKKEATAQHAWNLGSLRGGKEITSQHDRRLGSLREQKDAISPCDGKLGSLSEKRGAKDLREDSEEKLETSRAIMKRLDKQYEYWKKPNAKRGGEEGRQSVFSRLSFNVGSTMKNEERKRTSGGEIKQVDKAEESCSLNLKCDNSCPAKIVDEVESFMAWVEAKRRKLTSKSDTNLSESLPVPSEGSSASTVIAWVEAKRRKLTSKSGTNLSESLPVPSEGSSASTVNNTSCENPRECTMTDEKNAELSKDKQSGTLPFVCEGNGKGNEGAAEVEKNAPGNALKTPSKTVEKPSASISFVTCQEAVGDLKLCMGDDGEKEGEFLSPELGVHA